MTSTASGSSRGGKLKAQKLSSLTYLAANVAANFARIFKFNAFWPSGPHADKGDGCRPVSLRIRHCYTCHDLPQQQRTLAQVNQLDLPINLYTTPVLKHRITDHSRLS